MKWIMISIMVTGGGGRYGSRSDGSIYLSSYETEAECVMSVARRGEGNAICLQVSGVAREPTIDELAEVEAGRMAASTEYREAREASRPAREAREACRVTYEAWAESFFRRESGRPEACLNWSGEKLEIIEINDRFPRGYRWVDEE